MAVTWGQSVHGRTEPLPLSIANDDPAHTIVARPRIDRGPQGDRTVRDTVPRDRRSYLRVDAQDAAPERFVKGLESQRMVLG